MEIGVFWRNEDRNRSIDDNSTLFPENLLWLHVAAGNSYLFEHHVLFGALYRGPCAVNMGRIGMGSEIGVFRGIGSGIGIRFKILESVGSKSEHGTRSPQPLDGM